MKLRFPKGLENLKRVYTEVEKTHKGLGTLTILEILCDASDRALLVVGTSGTGKSTVMNFINRVAKRTVFRQDSVTVNGLMRYKDLLDYNKLSILVDDIERGQTRYSWIMTVDALGSLAYSHTISKSTQQINLRIENCFCSAIMNCQPLILRAILTHPTFEASIRDKVIRFYHLKRPKKPNPKPIVVDYTWEYLSKVKVDFPERLRKTKVYRDCIFNFKHEFTESRACEHLEALAKASALCNNRETVNKSDLKLIYQLSRNFKLELEIFYKKHLEGSRQLDIDLLPLMTVLASYSKFPTLELSLLYGVKKSQIYNILEKLSAYCYIIKNSGKSYIIPTEESANLLKEIGEA